MSANSPHVTGPAQVLILIAAEFDETAVVEIACRLRNEGFAVRLVALSSGLVTGIHGITLRPDQSLTQYPANSALNAADSLIISGGATCASLLLSDPRVHQLMQSMQNQHGIVAVMAGAQRMLAGVGGPSNYASPKFLPQNEMSTAEFVDQLINRLL